MHNLPYKSWCSKPIHYPGKSLPKIRLFPQGPWAVFLCISIWQRRVEKMSDFPSVPCFILLCLQHKILCAKLPFFASLSLLWGPVTMEGVDRVRTEHELTLCYMTHFHHSLCLVLYSDSLHSTVSLRPKGFVCSSLFTTSSAEHLSGHRWSKPFHWSPATCPLPATGMASQCQLTLHPFLWESLNCLQQGSNLYLGCIVLRSCFYWLSDRFSATWCDSSMDSMFSLTLCSLTQLLVWSLGYPTWLATWPHALPGPPDLWLGSLDGSSDFCLPSIPALRSCTLFLISAASPDLGWLPDLATYNQAWQGMAPFLCLQTQFIWFCPYFAPSWCIWFSPIWFSWVICVELIWGYSDGPRCWIVLGLSNNYWGRWESYWFQQALRPLLKQYVTKGTDLKEIEILC